MFFLVVSFLLVCALAHADTPPTRVGEAKNTCQKYTMCAAQTATGDCDDEQDGGGDEIVLDVFGRWSSFTFYGNQSIGSYSCVIHSNAYGHDVESGSYTLLSSTPLSSSNQTISLNGGNFGYIWVNCTTIATSVVVTLNACPASR